MSFQTRVFITELHDANRKDKQSGREYQAFQADVAFGQFNSPAKMRIPEELFKAVAAVGRPSRSAPAPVEVEFEIEVQSQANGRFVNSVPVVVITGGTLLQTAGKRQPASA